MYVYEEMVDMLYEKFPELREEYPDEIEYYKELYKECGDKNTGAYSHFENIFWGYIKSALENEPEDRNLLKRIFSFFEEMAISDDGGVSNLLQVALLENIWSMSYPTYKRAIKLMLPMTRKLSQEHSSYLAEPKPLSGT